MKKAIGLFALLLAIAAGARAQTITTVTGTVFDAVGLPFVNAPVNVTLVGGPPTPIVIATNSPVILPIAPTTNANGQFTVNLVATASISPATTYSIRVCAPAVIPPFGNGGGICSTITSVTIAGAAQDVSALFAALPPPALVNITNQSRVYNTPAPAGTTSIGLTPMTTVPVQPANGTHYSFSTYMSQTVLGVGCTGNTTITVNSVFIDPNAVGALINPIGTYQVTLNGSLGTVLLLSGGSGGQYAGTISFVAKPGTVVQFTTVYTLGAGCTTNPTVQLFPLLELQ